MLPWFILLIRILLAAPEIYDLVKKLLDMIRGLKSKQARKHYDSQLRAIVNDRLSGKRLKVTDDLEKMKREIEGLK
jgi:hypothetical protein